MHTENLIYDGSGTTEYRVERFNDGKSAIVHASIRFNSIGNISNIKDEDLINQVKSKIINKQL